MSLSPRIASHNAGSGRLHHDAAADAAFGEFLRLARERRGLTLDQICQETKIPRRHLEALEHGQLGAVPGGAYRRGEIVAYAKVVGLDRNVALARLARASEAFEPTPTATTAPPHRNVGGSWLVVVAALIVVALAAGVPWNRRNNAAGSGDASPPATQSQRSADPAATGSAAAPARSEERAVRDASPPTPSSPQPAAAASIPAASSVPDQTGTTDDGVLVIASDPAGARVTVDGIGWGTTPLTIRHLPPGRKAIRLTKDGFLAEAQVVRLVGGKTTEINIPLRAR